MPRMTARRRQPANFEVTYRSSVWKRTVTWKITADTHGITARRDDGRHVAISWERLISTALFWGEKNA